MRNVVNVTIASQSTVWASLTLTGDGRYAVFASSPLNGDIEEWLIGGFDSQDAAEEVARGIVERVGAADVTLASRQLQPAEHDPRFTGHAKEDLVESLEAQIAEKARLPSREAILASYVSPRFLFNIIYLVVIVEFIFGFRITIPEGIDIPLIGGLVAGWSLDRPDVAFYLPFALLLLMIVMIPSLVERNLRNDRFRRLIVELAIFHRLRRVDVRKAIAKEATLGDSAWAMDGAQMLLNGPFGKILGVRAWREPAAAADGQALTELASAEEVEIALDDEYDRRIHNMYWLGRQKGYWPTLIVFDPLYYVISDNRVRWLFHERAIAAGVDPLALPLVSNPDDPASAFRDGWSVLVIAALFSIPLVWGLFLIDGRSPAIVALYVLASLAFVGFYSIWILQAVVRRRGFPLRESVGAYTVDVIPRKLSLPGY